jgi:hypothetical protein
MTHCAHRLRVRAGHLTATGPVTPACSHDRWGRAEAARTALGEALVMRRRTRVRFPPPPPRGSPRKAGFVSPNPVIEEKPRSTPVSPRRARSDDRALRAFGVGRAVAPWATLGRRLHRYLRVCPAGDAGPGAPVQGTIRSWMRRGSSRSTSADPSSTTPTASRWCRSTGSARGRGCPGHSTGPSSARRAAARVTRTPRSRRLRATGRELYLLRGRGLAGCGTSSPPCWRIPSVDFSDRGSRSAVLLAASSACVPLARRSIPVADDLALRSVG